MRAGSGGPEGLQNIFYGRAGLNNGPDNRKEGLYNMKRSVFICAIWPEAGRVIWSTALHAEADLIREKYDDMRRMFRPSKYSAYRFQVIDLNNNDFIISEYQGKKSC